jgi:hypothetical protein
MLFNKEKKEKQVLITLSFKVSDWDKITKMYSSVEKIQEYLIKGVE